MLLRRFFGQVTPYMMPDAESRGGARRPEAPGFFSEVLEKVTLVHSATRVEKDQTMRGSR